MKKIYLFLISALVVTFAQAQQIYLNEDFSSGQMPPAGWTVENLDSQWTVENSNNAGGTAPEARFKWKQTITVTRLISPSMDLTGISSVVLSFRHFLDYYGGGGFKIGVATRSGSGDWHSVWETSPSANVGPEMKILQLNNEDLGSSEFQLCFYLDGNMYNLDYWYIDNIKMLVPAELNAEMISINTPSYISEPTEVKGSVRNFGNQEITSLDIEWQVNEDVYTTSFTGLNLQFGDSYDFTCTNLFDYPIGSYDLSVRIKSVNGVEDDFQADDTLVKQVNVVSSYVDKRPCYEEFTSSTCSPCAGFNSQFVPWCETHEDEITLVKYQMNWPGAGDPYYTSEGGVRRQYYGVTWVPWLQAEGNFTETSTAAAQAVLDQAADELGLMKIASSFAMSKGTEITVNTTVLPFANFNDFRIHMVVFEKETTGNTGSNGETSFQHVMMKMIPDANGTTVELQDRVPYTLSYTVDLAGTNVEEWDDLGVAIICQDYVSRKIYQSDYALENAAFASEAHLNSITVNGELLEGFDSDTYTYNIELPEGTTEVPVVEAQLMDENGTKVIVPANALPGSTTIDTYGEDLATHLTYTVNFTIATGVNENTVENLSVYPNPSTGKIFIAGSDIDHVKVYSLTGKVVYEQNSVVNNTVDLTGLENGIYLMTLVDRNQQTVTKRISLVK